MARRYWPDQNALGKRIRVGRDWHEVVGIAKDIKYRNLNEDSTPRMYLPALQNYDSRMIVVARSEGDPSALLPAMQTAVRELDANLPLLEVTTFAERARASFFTQQTAAKLLTAFGLLALALSAAGLYGVIAYLVSQHTREIGIRMALGAQKRDVLKLIVGHGMILTFAGIALGLIGAFALTRLAASMLYGVTATDPLTFSGVTALLLLVALLACYIPARRAAKVDPMVALRYE